MATTTLTIHQKAVRSTVALKALMAITGLCLIGFLLMHMYGNLKVFMGADSFNHYAHWLKGDPTHLPKGEHGILYPLVPDHWFIRIFRVFMLVVIALHMYSAITLWQRARVATASKYQNKKVLEQTYSAATMRWGGLILAGGLLFHLLQFTAMMIRTGFTANAQPYDMVVASFSQWWLVVVYAIWMIAVCMHVRHGVWSAFTTLGANTSENARKVLNWCAYAVAVILYAGFMVMPLAVALNPGGLFS